MSGLFSSTYNTRSILPDDLRYLRSDVPDHLTDSEISWLISHNIRTVIDLRGDEERSARPCRLQEDSRFIYHCCPVTGGNSIPASKNAVVESYICMVDRNMEIVLNTILNAESGVLYFCNAGKDRTGVVSAILLKKLGMDREYIIQDYLKSRDNLLELLMNYADKYHVNPEIIIPQRQYMEQFLDWLEK